MACFQILRWVGIHKTYYDGLTIILKVGVSYHQSDHYCGKVLYFLLRHPYWNFNRKYFVRRFCEYLLKGLNYEAFLCGN